MSKVIVITLLQAWMIKATMNHFERVDTSAPELEIDQREYSNPSILHTSNVSQANKASPLVADQKHVKKTAETKQRFYGTKNTTPKPKVRKMSLSAEHIEGLQHNPWSDNKQKEEPESSDRAMQYIPLFTEEYEMDYRKDDQEIVVASYLKNNPPEKDRPRKIIGPERNPNLGRPPKGIGPGGVDEDDKPTCHAFSKTARFNPYSVLDSYWFAFYFWANENSPVVLDFFVPTAREVKHLRSFMDFQVDTPINWTARIIIMNDHLYNASGLLVERSDRGTFWMYPIRPEFQGDLFPMDMRFKQTGDCKYMIMIICNDDRAYVMSRVTEVPRKKDIPDAVALLGWRARDGRSYLYQGHKWGPVPEMNEDEYWMPPNLRKEEELPPPPPEEETDDDDSAPLLWINTRK